MANGGLIPAVGDSTATGSFGTGASRIDGRLKVTGAAPYGSDFLGGARPVQAWLVTSAIARGRITALDDRAARAVPGVIDVMTWRDVGNRIKPGTMMLDKGFMGTTIAPLASDQVQHIGQIVAIVLAETPEAAREGAARMRVDYASETPSASFGAPGITASEAKPDPKEKPARTGDAEGALAKAAVRIDQRYATPTQHHNPIELFTTVCAWDGDQLTVWESSQNVSGFRHGLAEQLGISPRNVRIISPFIGGAFGCRGSLTQRTALIALAAQRLRRPVRLEATRSQGFTIATYRAETQHRVRLGAAQDGKLQALIHEGWEFTSRPDKYKVAGVDASTRVYACPNIDSKVTLVQGDRSTPGFMRSPPETPYIFALESAMDELAYALRMDPVELRRVNDTMHEPVGGLPFTSRNLMPCFDAAAKEFGWAKRKPEPGAMRDGEWAIGWGCATTLYPTNVAPATARVTLDPDGGVRVQTGGHEIGNGLYTAAALTAAQGLGVALGQVQVALGDSDLPPAPVAGGSNSTASICTVIARACDDIRARLAAAAVADQASALHGADPAALRLENGQLRGPGGAEPLNQAMQRAAGGAIEAYAETIPHGAPAGSLRALYGGTTVMAGGTQLKDRVQFAFGAQFVEVRVHLRTREIRVPRAVSAFSAGRIVNPKAAKSQLMGGQIWGISAALHEATEIDRRFASYTNDDLAEYLVPVNADITDITTILVPEEDHAVNPLGIKGLGELGNVGMNAAVANAVFHATGVRVRELPIRMEKLLGA